MVNIHDNVYSRGGADGRSHIPALPFWVAIIRIVQLIFALLVLCLTAFAASVFGADFFQGYPMSWFTFVWTVAFLLYIFVTPLFIPQFYLYWAHLGLEIATVVFWLTTFALLAQESQAWDEAQSAVNELNGLEASVGLDIVVWSKAESAIKASKAATAFGALNWLLFVVTLIVFGYFLHNHRVANGATGFGGFTSRAPGRDVESAEKTQPQVELRQVPEPQQVYQQQPQQQVYEQVPQQQVYQQVPQQQVYQQQPAVYPST